MKKDDIFHKNDQRMRYGGHLILQRQFLKRIKRFILAPETRNCVKVYLSSGDKELCKGFQGFLFSNLTPYITPVHIYFFNYNFNNILYIIIVDGNILTFLYFYSFGTS